MGNAGRGFGVLGPLQLNAGGTAVPLGAPKQRAVLAMLVINRNRPVSVESLINAVWNQSPVPAARTSIHSYVSNLRRLLWGAGYDPNEVLASAPPGHQLSVADADCDLGRFITEKTAGSTPPPRDGSKMPAATYRLRWLNGAGRSSMT
jgi:SARP family transcriptional regulator, regulator of embCAB operon